MMAMDRMYIYVRPQVRILSHDSDWRVTVSGRQCCDFRPAAHPFCSLAGGTVA